PARSSSTTPSAQRFGRRGLDGAGAPAGVTTTHTPAVRRACRGSAHPEHVELEEHRAVVLALEQFMGGEAELARVGGAVAAHRRYELAAPVSVTAAPRREIHVRNRRGQPAGP